MVGRTGIRHGRGATSAHVPQRFGLAERQDDGDWLDSRELIDGGAPPLRTTTTEEHPRTILTFNRSPDLPFDRSVNPYRGCEHGCIYCFARPTHAYHDLSPGLDFETKLFAKPNAAELLRSTFLGKNYEPRVVAIGTNTDPYQPIEARYRIMPELLRVFREFRHPVALTTKSNRIVDDIDQIAELAADGLAAVAISITSLDPALLRKLEPRAPHFRKRLEAVRRLSEAGIPTFVNFAPLIPAINDHELEQVAQAAREAGASGFSAIPLRLPHEVAPLFEEWLDAHYPDRKAKVLSIVRQLRAGKLNDPQFGSRMRGSGVWSDLIRARLKRVRGDYDLDSEKWRLRTDLFRRPAPPPSAQKELF